MSAFGQKRTSEMTKRVLSKIAVLTVLKGLISLYCKQELRILLGFSNLGRDKNPYDFSPFRYLRQNRIDGRATRRG
jgi:hypothetical protein